MNRRSFLKSALAFAAAPAIVNSENLMKLWVPKKFLELNVDFQQEQEYNVSFWMKRPDGEWTLYTKNLNHAEKRDRRIILDEGFIKSSASLLTINGIMQRG